MFCLKFGTMVSLMPTYVRPCMCAWRGDVASWSAGSQDPSFVRKMMFVVAQKCGQ